MNQTDKIAVGIMTALSACAYLYTINRKNHGKPVAIMGLNSDHTKKLFLAISVLGAGVLLYPVVKHKLA